MSAAEKLIGHTVWLDEAIEGPHVTLLPGKYVIEHVMQSIFDELKTVVQLKGRPSNEWWDISRFSTSMPLCNATHEDTGLRCIWGKHTGRHLALRRIRTGDYTSSAREEVRW